MKLPVAIVGSFAFIAFAFVAVTGAVGVTAQDEAVHGVSVSSPVDGAASRWQRVLLPPAATPMAEQCVVVDADLYAHAAPGLRDVRLVQDGQELPYAMDVSFDTRVGDAAAPPADDRALYEPVQTIRLLPQPAAAVAGTLMGDVPDTYYNETLLSAHVPVERVRIVPAPKAEATVDLRASARMNLRQAEELRAVLTAEKPVVPFTIGANLQEPADILVRVVDHGGAPQAIVLEMRRREICYQPRSMSAVHMLLGDATALPPRYDYALRFQPSAQPLLAAMGPMSPNPAYREQQASAPVLRVSAGVRTAVMLVILLGSLAVMAFAIVELRRK
ncbi:hypothetical protein SAMN05444167_2863 [Terriglobus roseus]|uniref:Oxygen tolerance n=2 Tax=Terriglobus roseus TaxID=392734 RepID=A0A1G7MP44_9BACT|nr:hypothetical protein SAMN05444167_2863 [Terriglobus roseus]